MAHRFALGLDFGTESVRAVLVDPATGRVAATAVDPYGDGVIDRALPGGGDRLPPDWALQNPADWLDSMTRAVRAALREGGVAPQAVAGVGVDFTACTILPARVDGSALCAGEPYRARPHAWPKLWKHHAAQSQADQVNRTAAEREETWLARYGGRISSEWLLPKALQLFEEDRDAYAAADALVEGADWVVWQLTGRLVRNTCAAGYKATWHKGEGFPSADFLAAAARHSEFANLYREKLSGPLLTPGARAGELTAAWAEALGLAPGTPVAAPIVDAHAAVLGAGICAPGVMLMIMGTSTCHMLMAEREVLVEGISGVVEDGIVSGLFGYEAGQAAVGDIFAWFVNRLAPPALHEEAAAAGRSLHEVLSARGERLRPGESGLLALDWWNGNRSTLVDAGLSGLLVGCTLTTRPEEIYRALIEGTAYGTRVIVDAEVEAGLPVESVVAAGGLAKNAFLMQIYADVLGREIAVAGAPQASALGAAVLGALAAGAAGGGHGRWREAVAAMAPPPARVYRPQPEHRATYEALYREYRRLYGIFGREQRGVMATLRQLQEAHTG